MEAIPVNAGKDPDGPAADVQPKPRDEEALSFSLGASFFT